jgi:hypothetical protein
MTASLNKDSNSTYEYKEHLLFVTPEYNFDQDGSFAGNDRPLDVYPQQPSKALQLKIH